MDKKTAELVKIFDNEDIDTPPKWEVESFYSNTSKEPYSPLNLLRHVLTEKGYHIRFEPDAVNIIGKHLPDSSSIHIDDPLEKDHVDRITMAILENPLYKDFFSAYNGLIIKNSFAFADLEDEDRKSLKALAIKRTMDRAQEAGNTQSAQDCQSQLDVMGVTPYPFQKMRDKIKDLVDGILIEHPDWAPHDK